MNQLESWVGLGSTTLQLIRSYLSERTLSIVFGNTYSSSTHLNCGVPQGSILGRLLFSIYLLPLGHVIHSFNIQFHFYADNIQFYVLLNTSTPVVLLPLRPARLIYIVGCTRISYNSTQTNQRFSCLALSVPDSTY